MLYNWDAVQFALALSEFDVAKHQPHPPGYLFYVALARVLNVSLGDPTLAYVALSMLFSAATTFTVYWLARAIYGRLTAAAAAALLAVSPLFWFYGSVGLTYAGEAFAASLIALLAWRTLGGSVRHLYAGAVVLGLAGGLRLSVLVLMLPLWAGAAIVGISSPRRIDRRGPPHRQCLCLARAGPVALRRPGRVPLRLRRALPPDGPPHLGGQPLSRGHAGPDALSAGVGDGRARAPRPRFPGPAWYARRRGWGRSEWFLVGWMVPAVAFYTLVHFGQAGYVLLFLPALVILLSRALVELVSAGSESLRIPHWRRALTVAALVPLMVVNTGFFVSARPERRDFERRGGESWFEAWRWKARDELHDWVMSRTVAALREHEAVIRTYVESIRGLYDPADTALLTEIGNPRSYPVAPPRDVLHAGVRDLPARPGRPPRLLRAPVRGDHALHPAPRGDRAEPHQATRLVRGPLGPDVRAPRRAARDRAPLRPVPLRAAASRGAVEHAGYAFVREHP